MRLRTFLVIAGIVFAPALVGSFAGCGGSYMSEEESMKQIEKEEKEEMQEPDAQRGFQEEEDEEG